MASDVSLAESAQTALASGQYSVALGVAAVGGFLTALSPCVYPIIPITISVFGARETKSRWQAFSLALMYTAGMVLLYAVLGTAFASAGKVFGTLLSNKWVVLGFSAFCAAMAISMLGFFEFRIPSSLQTKLSTVGGRGYQGAFVMGLVSGIIAAPCTGPVLSALLTFIASTKDTTVGFTLMLAYGMGMGLPFLALATFSSSLQKLPRSGSWMDWVKAVLAVAMIALSLYYAQFAFPDIVPQSTFSWLPWAFIMLGIAAGAIHLSVHGTPWHEKGRKIFGSMLVGAGLFLAFGAVAKPHATEVHWQKSYAKGIADATQQKKPVLIDFFATWCAACVELDEKTFSKPEMARTLERFVTIKVDATQESDDILELYKKYSVKGLPTLVLIDSQGNVLEKPRVTGFMEAPELRDLLGQVQ